MIQFIMKIGEYDINDADELKINQILSEFFGFECRVIDRVTSGLGRSVRVHKQYRLNINYTQVLN